MRVQTTMMATLTAVLAWASAGDAQAPAPVAQPAAPPQPPLRAQVQRFVIEPEHLSGLGAGGGFVFSDGSARNEVHRIVNELRDAEESKRADLTKQLETAVATSFDEDLKARETELTKLEQRLNKLRAQLDRRRTAKADIIQLQIKVLVNEADGLGFSSSPALDLKGFPNASGGYGYPVTIQAAPSNVPPPASPRR